MAYMTRGSARSAAITRAAFRRRGREELTPALFDNTPLQHDGRSFNQIERETAPAASPGSSALIPPTSQVPVTTAGALELDRKAPAAGQNGGSGAEVVQTTVPSKAETPPAGAVLVCPCGCNSVLGAFKEQRHLVCRDFWFSLPHEVRRRTLSTEESVRVAACRLVLKMAIARRRSMLSPAIEGTAELGVAARGEPGGPVLIPASVCAPITPAVGGRDLGVEPADPEPEERQVSPAGSGMIFHCRPALPEPLSKASSPETSGEAGRAFGGERARTLRGQVLLLLKNSQMIELDPDRPAACGPGLTADECAKALTESVLAVRPRLSELHKAGLIEDSGQRRPNLSGHGAVVWRLAGCDGGAL